jgi:DNA-binding XRE family transcriptional regulator
MMVSMSEEATIAELERRLLSALLQPVVSMCRRFRVPLSELEGLSRLAYYEALRDGAGATQAEVAAVFGTSLRTVVGVEKRLRSRFEEDEAELTLWRQVEAAIGAVPVTANAVATELGANVARVQRALSGLVATGQATLTEPEDAAVTYVASERFHALVRADLVARIDGLKHQLEVVEGAVTSRFLGDDAGGPAVARTLAFVGTPEDVEAMATALVKAMRMHAIEVEEKALAGDTYARYGVTLALAPTRKDP